MCYFKWNNFLISISDYCLSYREHLDFAYKLYNFVKHKCVYLVTQSHPTLCDPMDCSQVSLSIGILQARILEWIAISSSRGYFQPRE